MLRRTRRLARARAVADQVETLAADVAALPVPDGTFDVVLSLTGLHCFPDPRAAVLELGRVTRAGGTLSLSWLRTDGGLRYAPVVTAGRLSGVVGPSGTVQEVRTWLFEAGFTDLDLTVSGALAYIRARRS
jgi:ubiquinone/menaquinone biosynthesis C-methylase UbiE